MFEMNKISDDWHVLSNPDASKYENSVEDSVIFSKFRLKIIDSILKLTTYLKYLFTPRKAVRNMSFV